MRIDAIFRGGPADGRLMVVRDLRDVLFDQLAEDPRAFWSKEPAELLEPVLTRRYRYEPARIVAEFVVGGVS